MGKILLLFFVFTLISPSLLQPIWPFFDSYDGFSNEMGSNSFDSINPGYLSRKIEEDQNPWRSKSYRDYFQHEYKPASSMFVGYKPLFEFGFASSFGLGKSTEEDLSSAPELTSPEIGDLFDPAAALELISIVTDILQNLEDPELKEEIEDYSETKDSSEIITGPSANNPNVDVMLVIPDFDETIDEKTTVAPFTPNVEESSSGDDLEPVNNINSIENILKEILDNKPLSEELDGSTLPTLNSDYEFDLTSERIPDNISENIDNDENLFEKPNPEQKIKGRETEWDEDSDEYNAIDTNENDVKLLDELNSKLPVYKVVHRK